MNHIGRDVAMGVSMRLGTLGYEQPVSSRTELVAAREYTRKFIYTRPPCPCDVTRRQCS